MNRTKVSMAIHEADLEPVAAALARFEDLRFEPGQERGAGKWHDLVERLLDNTHRLHRLKQALHISDAVEKKPLPGINIEKAVDDGQRLLEEIEEKLQALEERKNEVNAQLERLRILSKNWERLQQVGISFRQMQHLSYIHLECGWIPSDQKDRIHLAAVSTPLVIMPIFESGGKWFIAASALQKDVFVLTRILQSLFYEALELDPWEPAAGRERQDLEHRIAVLRENLESISRNRQRLAKDWADHLVEADHQAQAALKTARILDRYGRTGEMVIFDAAIPEKEMDALFRTLREKAVHPHRIFAESNREAL